MRDSRETVWLASYPRSGNTLLRAMLHSCFGIRSTSVYRGDLGYNCDLERYAGHVELDACRSIRLNHDGLLPVKTHRPPFDSAPAIYIVRDGRAASVSLWEFMGCSMSLKDVILGNHQFGTWSDHLNAWKPWERPQTLFLKYEEVLADTTNNLAQLSRFLDREIISNRLPERSDIAHLDGHWVRDYSDWSTKMAKHELDWFFSVNGEMMRTLGYVNR